MTEKKIKAANFDDIVVTLVINSDEYQKVECHNGACRRKRCYHECRINI
ncbi:MAG: hypothetical protein ACLUTO_02150 [Anaerostipes sp.]